MTVALALPSPVGRSVRFQGSLLPRPSNPGIAEQASQSQLSCFLMAFLSESPSSVDLTLLPPSIANFRQAWPSAADPETA